MNTLQKFGFTITVCIPKTLTTLSLKAILERKRYLMLLIFLGEIISTKDVHLLYYKTILSYPDISNFPRQQFEMNTHLNEVEMLIFVDKDEAPYVKYDVNNTEMNTLQKFGFTITVCIPKTLTTLSLKAILERKRLYGFSFTGGKHLRFRK
jgi:hypothetical protein